MATNSASDVRIISNIAAMMEEDAAIAILDAAFAIAEAAGFTRFGDSNPLTYTTISYRYVTMQLRRYGGYRSVYILLGNEQGIRAMEKDGTPKLLAGHDGRERRPFADELVRAEEKLFSIAQSLLIGDWEDKGPGSIRRLKALARMLKE